MLCSTYRHSPISAPDGFEQIKIGVSVVGSSLWGGGGAPAGIVDMLGVPCGLLHLIMHDHLELCMLLWI